MPTPQKQAVPKAVIPQEILEDPQLPANAEVPTLPVAQIASEVPEKAASEKVPSRSVSQEGHDLIHGARRESYGDPHESFGRIAVGWSEIVGVPLEPVQVALMMDWLKTCRFLTNRSRDDLVDKCGYTGLAAILVGID